MKRMRLLAGTAVAQILMLAAAQAGQQPGGQGPAPVRVAEVEEATMAPATTAPGTVVNRNDARLSAEVAGRLEMVADIGTKVEKGDTVARIEDKTLRIQLAEAEARMQSARARVDYLTREATRLERLAEQENAAKNRLDQVESDRNVARADLAMARAQADQVLDRIDRTTLAAPFDGTVTRRFLKPGERVSVGENVVHVADPDSVEVVVRAPLEAVGHLSPGESVEVRSRHREDTGTLRAVVPFGSDESHLFELRIDVHAERWRAGETVRVAIPLARPAKVLAVPRDALILRRDGARVFVIDGDDKARPVPVTPGLGSGDLVAVEGALTPGDRVVIRGGERLRPGQSVRILEGPVREGEAAPAA